MHSAELAWRNELARTTLAGLIAQAELPSERRAARWLGPPLRQAGDRRSCAGPFAMSDRNDAGPSYLGPSGGMCRLSAVRWSPAGPAFGSAAPPYAECHLAATNFGQFVNGHPQQDREGIGDGTQD